MTPTARVVLAFAVFIGVGVLAAAGFAWRAKLVPTIQATVPSSSAAATAHAPTAAEQTKIAIRKLDAMQSWRTAFAAAQPAMRDTQNEVNQGTTLFALWAARQVGGCEAIPFNIIVM
jgi:hypothetical protein